MAPTTGDLAAAARAWIAGDPDPDTRAELQDLLDRDDHGALADRLGGTLEFGTAGLRGPVGAGPNRMNRAVVIRTTRGLADHLRATRDPAPGPVVVGFDARPDSLRFATDAVAVLAAAGLTVRYFADPVPTPLVAYAARVLGAAAAVVVTASHNPAGDNGYKVYGAGGVHIAPPVDAEIAAAVDAVGPAAAVPHGGDALAAVRGASPVPDDLAVRYLAALDDARPALVATPDLRIAYTPLHGVGWGYVRAALARAGHRDVRVVVEQAEPDGDFPTAPSPNPEEAGTLDRVVDLAVRTGADLLLANDPDADRLAAGVPEGGGVRLLTGNQVGVLLADYLLAHAPAVPAPLLVSSVVSSPLLGVVAAAHGARHEVTLTGFKWICAAAIDLERDGGVRFVFGCEEALGYAVGTVVRDKDGIGAAVALADLAARCRAVGTTLLDHLERLYRRHGLWVSHQQSVTYPGPGGGARRAAAMAAIGADRAPERLAGLDVTGVRDFRRGAGERPRWLPAADLVEVDLGPAGRALVRPSGTEPKLKVYVDLRRELSGDEPLRAAETELGTTARSVARELLAFLDGAG